MFFQACYNMSVQIPSPVKFFVFRPSGTEDVVRVYAEADTRVSIMFYVLYYSEIKIPPIQKAKIFGFVASFF